MAFKVLLTDDAAHDLEELYNYITEYDAPEKADYVLNQIEKICATLSTLPDRGTHPKELSALGIRDYREVFFKPYRIIYRKLNGTIYIYLIVDGRRDMQTLLLRRILSASV